MTNNHKKGANTQIYQKNKNHVKKKSRRPDLKKSKENERQRHCPEEEEKKKEKKRKTKQIKKATRHRVTDQGIRKKKI